jgi:hypothetical protein
VESLGHLLDLRSAQAKLDFHTTLGHGLEQGAQIGIF